MVGTVAVTGATGFVGRHVVRELVGRGVRVRALARDLQKASEVLGSLDGVSLVEGDMSDVATMERLATGAEAMVNTVGIIREASGGQTFQRVHVDSVRLLVQGMARAGCDRIVHVSAMGVGEEAGTKYATSKYEGERLVRNSELRWTIIRPNLIHGPEGEFTQMAADWARGREAPFVFMPYFARIKPGSGLPKPEFEAPKIQPVSVEDVARAVAEALAREHAVGEVYPLVGAEVLDWPEMLEFVRDHVSLAREGIKAVPIPGDLAAIKAKATTMLGLGALLPFDEGMAKMGSRDSVSNSRKASEHLGLDPAGFREVAAGYLASM